MDIIKIQSGEIANYLYLREATKGGKRIIMSTSMCTVDEVRDTVEVLEEYSLVEFGVRNAGKQTRGRKELRSMLFTSAGRRADASALQYPVSDDL